MSSEQDVGRALAFFDACNDLPLLLSVLRGIRPRAAQEVGRFERTGRAVPPPAKVAAAPEAASREEALRTVRALRDFALLQAVSRRIGRRVEELQSRGGRAD
jgi:hypothetical protein